MSESQTPASGADLPQAEVRSRRGRHRRLSSIWIIPLVAAIVGAGLAYRAFQERGLEITITFETAAGIEPGKTTIRYRAVEIGIVDGIGVSEKGDYVTVTASVHRSVEGHAVEGTRFWVVRPRVGAGGISGLGTLVSGDYIAVDPGPPGGKRMLAFKGLENPPIDRLGWTGLRVELTASRLHGLNVGSPVTYRDLTVGSVARRDVDESGEHFLIQALIDHPHSKLVYANTKFWNASGMDAKVGLDGVEVDVESLMTLVAGGIAFDTFGRPGKPVEQGAGFELYDGLRGARRAFDAARGLHIAVETPRLGSLENGDPVYYREVQVGRILDHALHADGRSVGVKLQIDSTYAHLVRTNSVFWNASGLSADLGLSGLHVHAESLKSLLEGGIAFATPDKPGARAKAGSVFQLQPEAKEKWSEWSPRLESGGSSPDDAELHHHKEEAKQEEKSHHWFRGMFHHDDG